jgi:protein-disulfide isomerase
MKKRKKRGVPMSSIKNQSTSSEQDKEKGRRRKRIVIVSSAIVILLIAAVAAMIFRDQQKTPATASKQAETHRTAQSLHINYSGQPYTGSSNAPVKVVEFADYRCPYCKLFAENIFPRLKKDYIDRDQVSFYFINYTILGPGSRLAANAAEEVYHQNPKGFWAFHRALFQAQGDEKKEWVTKDLLTRIASKTVPSLDVKAFRNALDTHSHNRQIQSDNAMAEELGVPGTPAIFVNGKSVENGQDYATLKQAIDHALQRR